MTKPATIAPAKPEIKMKRSAGARFAKLVPNSLKAKPLFVKYSINRTLSTIKMTTIGYIIAIIHDILNSIFNKNPIPKNNTKKSNMDMINITIVTKNSPYNLSLTVY
jgi:hypothetical protein